MIKLSVLKCELNVNDGKSRNQYRKKQPIA